MHPPLLPNPSGEGLQFYKKKFNSNTSEAVGNSSNITGIADTGMMCISLLGHQVTILNFSTDTFVCNILVNAGQS